MGLSIDEGVVGFSETGALNAACIATPWFVSVGFVVTFAALFSKLWRLNRVCSTIFYCLCIFESLYFSHIDHLIISCKIIDASLALRHVMVTANDVLLPFFVLTIINLATLTVWVVVDPMHWRRIILDQSPQGNVLSSKGQCHSSHYSIYASSLSVVNGVCVLLACHQAYRSRNAQTDFNESKYIGMTMICIFQSVFFGIPVLCVSASNPSAILCAYTSIIFVICVATLLFTFLPIIYKSDQMDQSAAHISSSTVTSRMSTLNPRLKALRAEQRANRQYTPSSETLHCNGVHEQSKFRRNEDLSEVKQNPQKETCSVFVVTEPTNLHSSDDELNGFP